MLFINNSSTPYSEQRVTLGNSSYVLVFKYNSRNDSWYITLLDSSAQVEIISGVKLEPNQAVTNRYILEDFAGVLVCLRVSNDYSPLSFSNLGRGKVYRLAWVSEEEAALFGVNNAVQLF